MAKPDAPAEEAGDALRELVARWALDEAADADEAVLQMTALARSYPSRPEVLLALALTFVRAGRAGPANEALRRARFLAPEVARQLPREVTGAETETQAQLVSALRRLDAAVAEAVQTDTRAQERQAATPALANVERQAELEMAADELLGTPSQRAGPGKSRQSQGSSVSGDGVMAPLHAPGEAFAPPLPCPSALPDGWMLGRIALELWVRRFAAWSAPLIGANVVVAVFAADTWPGPIQALTWLAAFAVGAPVTLRWMAREWGSESEEAESGRPASVLWTPLTLFLVCGATLGLLSLRLAVRGEELFALGMLVSLPLLALFAPALVEWVTGKGGLRTGLEAVRTSLSRRSLAHVGVMGVVGGLGGVVLGGLGWGFLVTLHLIDTQWIRVVLGVIMSLPEGLLLALITTLGLDSRAIRPLRSLKPQTGGLSEARSAQ